MLEEFVILNIKMAEYVKKTRIVGWEILRIEPENNSVKQDQKLIRTITAKGFCHYDIICDYTKMKPHKNLKKKKSYFNGTFLKRHKIRIKIHVY